ncbi:unnamed protein product [Vitrella brassicaformis CCMP3155]|uniref:RanBP2-type domain-containing protein n=1 Tax=Vitrella brassicaformis (strain CCMP3155) TaxID=1169540 RepID=A0A0G4ECT7_VITBC|nr:unnamed protein product [Vitrella brassicaformis CCMP3155]|eukprot:CEL93791.1 unnamed protein product [Vitrella brassicaformis CCMP3155]
MSSINGVSGVSPPSAGSAVRPMGRRERGGPNKGVRRNHSSGDFVPPITAAKSNGRLPIHTFYEEPSRLSPQLADAVEAVRNSAVAAASVNGPNPHHVQFPPAPSPCPSPSPPYRPSSPAYVTITTPAIDSNQSSPVPYCESAPPSTASSSYPYHSGRNQLESPSRKRSSRRARSSRPGSHANTPKLEADQPPASDMAFLNLDRENSGRSATGGTATTPPPGLLAGSNRWLVTQEYTRLRLYSEVDPREPLKRIVDEARRYVNEWKSLEGQMDSFWHRKSSKIVLAVVMVVDKNGQERFYRGMNSEISLPSGSNCAERAAISACISNSLTVRRSDFRAIAVVDPKDELNPIAPCGVCDEWLKKLQEESPTFSIVTFTTSDCDEILERCPLLFQKEMPPSDTPPHLRENWACRACGFQYNPPLVARCQQCREPRFRFRPRNRKERIKVMGLIKSNCPSEPTSRDVSGVESVELERQVEAGVLPELDGESLQRILNDLKSLKFIERMHVGTPSTHATAAGSPPSTPYDFSLASPSPQHRGSGRVASPSPKNHTSATGATLPVPLSSWPPVGDGGVPPGAGGVRYRLTALGRDYLERTTELSTPPRTQREKDKEREKE